MIQHTVPVIGLDIGTAKTVATVGWRHEKYGVEIVGAAMARTRGIERGVLTDANAAAATVEEVLHKVEALLRERRSRQRARDGQVARVPALYVAVGGDHVLGSNAKGMLTLADRPVEVTRKDMRRVIGAGEALALSRNREIVHTLPQEFIVDGHTRSRDPRGMFAGRLGVGLHIISGDGVILKSLMRTVHRAGYDVDGVIYSGIATSQAVVTPEDKQRGTVLLELGAGTVNILFFSDGSLQYSSVLASGGRDITHTLADALGIDRSQAEHLKMQYQSSGEAGSAAAAWGDDKIIIKKENAAYESISRADLARIIDAAVAELLGVIRQDLSRAGIPLRSGAGIVLAGGMTFMDGIMDMVEQALDCPVRLATMRGFVSSQHGISNLFYATSIGTVMYALSQQQEAQPEPAGGPRVVRYVAERLRQWYEDYF